MNFQSFKVLFSMLLILGCAACSGFDKLPVRIWQSSHADLAPYREKAEAFEAEDELEAALLHWRVIRSLRPGDVDAADQIDRLQSEINDRSDRHFQRGLEAFNSRDLKTARREFLSALRVNSQHRQALEYLKRNATGDRYDVHQVKPKETFRSLAKRYYRDGKKAVLIARFNDLDPLSVPAPGTALRIPKTSLKPVIPTVGRKQTNGKDLTLARRLYRGGNYDRAARIAEQVLADTPNHKEAAEIYNSALFEDAKRLREKKSYPEAMSLLRKIDAEWPGVQPAIKDLRKTMDAMAEDHYRLGMKYFVDEELELAIQEWKKALSLNPDHSKAATSITEATGLLDALKKTPSTLPRP